MGGHKGRGTEGSRCRRRRERGVLMWVVDNYVLFVAFLGLRMAWELAFWGGGGFAMILFRIGVMFCLF